MAKSGAGRLRHKVSIYRESSTDFDSRGQTVAASTVMFRTYAEMLPLRGTETEYARKLTGTETHRVTIRYTTFFGDVTNKCWLEYDGRRFEIVSAVDVDGKNRWMQLLCGEDL